LRRQEDKLKVVQGWKPETPRTKDAVQVLNKLGLEKPLVVDVEEGEALFRSLRNLDRAGAIAVDDLSVYDILYHDELVLTEEAAKRLNEKFKTELSRKEKELQAQQEAAHA
jgi:large subunit ribosomal protein L4